EHSSDASELGSASTLYGPVPDSVSEESVWGWASLADVRLKGKRASRLRHLGSYLALHPSIECHQSPRQCAVDRYSPHPTPKQKTARFRRVATLVGFHGHTH